MPKATIIFVGDSPTPVAIARGESVEIDEHDGLVRVQMRKSDGTTVLLFEAPADRYTPKGTNPPVTHLVSGLGKRDLPPDGVTQYKRRTD